MLPRLFRPVPKSFRLLLLAGVAAVALSACATSPMTTGSIGDAPAAGMAGKQAAALAQLGERYKKSPGDRATILYYAAALRANGQSPQAVAVLENGVATFKTDKEMLVAFAKALAASGQFERALNVIDRAIDPAAPGWNELLVKGAILDQSGRNDEARLLYGQALKIAPEQASVHANLGLSYAMTNELDKAESELRLAVKMRGATTQVRQNLALVVGLQGRFDESRALFAAELPPDQVEANMAYIKSLLTQQNRWDLVKQQG
ncbi:MAG: tetratricopeptide repeat protein [Devosia sp.]|uniref:tetratricopeptide repeat protein n=1 Tax=Devosia sp. TaxID=1871048 RepID=UPI001ACA8161|nr:tetratricopeptide repeat protein [Devosia sp.]MBN9314900.1 tetratricopeptide repeat protein [Devosia sp.]